MGGIIRDNTAHQLASNLYLGGADSTLTVGEKTLLHGGTIAGDVLFAQGGKVDLADTQSLYNKNIEDAANLVWLKNDNETGNKAVQENADAQTIYTLAPAGENTGSYAARIGSDKYFSINQAIKALEAADKAEDTETNTTTIHLLRDQTEDVTINNTKHNPTLNLNGYTLTGQINVSNLNSVGLTFTLCGDTTQPDSNTEAGGNVFTGKGSGLVVGAQTNNAATKDHVTVKLQDVTLDGFGGNAVVLSSWGKLVAQNVTFSNNRCTGTLGRGAAIGFSGAGTLVADNCKFTNNSITNGSGGAIYMNNPAGRAVITNCEFTDNKAPNGGGALYLRAHAITLRGSRFAGNSANGLGGAGYLIPSANEEKAAAETEAYGSYDAVLENNTFENNTAYNQGGALYIEPSAIAVTTLIDRCTFTNNSTTTAGGGAVYNYQGSLYLGTSNVFEENKSYGGGSAMVANGNLLSVRDIENVELPTDGYDTQFINNTAGYGNYSGGHAALYVGGGSSKHMRNMLFDGNVAAYGNTASAIYIGNTAFASTTQRDMWIDHCRFEDNVANRYTVYVDTNYANNNLLRINDTVFDNNTVKYGRTDSEAAVLYVSYGNNMEMSDCTITNTQGEGRILRHFGGGTLDKDGNAVPATSTFTRVTIADNKNCYYTPITVTNANDAGSDEWKTRSIQAQSTWTDCTITGNVSSVNTPDAAGGFAVYKQNVTLDHCTISNNSGGNGGVYVSTPLGRVGFGDQQESVVAFNNCTITGNHGTAARGAGGMGISFYQTVRGIVNLNDCKITDNTGNYGGGIRVGGNDNDDWNASGLGTLNAANCTISGNTATVKGGGIFASTYDTVDGESRLHLTNCKIKNNTANYGGGIYAARQIKPESRNKDSQYRDYYMKHAANTQTMSVTGGTIADNTAKTYGGGICTDVVGKNTYYSTIIVRVADGTVENNRAQLGQDVYAYKTTADTVLHLPKASDIHDNGRWLNENTSETLKDEAIDYDPIQRTYPLTLSVPKVESEVAKIVETNAVYNSLQEAMDAARALLAENPDQKLTVQLLNDTNSSTLVSQGTNVTLDLAGYSIKGIGGKPALTIESSVAIVGGGTISGTATDGGALLLRSNAAVTMTDTKIENSRAAYRGGAVFVDGGSSFTLGRGSSITGCQAGRGGAVYVIDGSFTQTDGAVITDCSVFENAAFTNCGYGGAVYVAKGSYTLQSGAVTNSSAPQNGVIYIANNNGAEFTMTGGEVSGNKSRTGAIYQSGGTMTLTDGTITNNTGTENGGGVYQNGGTSLVRGGTITGNTAQNGAGWYMNGGTCLVRGGDITGNKATKRGGGVYQAGGNSSMTVNGGRITANNAPEGGGLCHANGKFNFQGGALYANISTSDGTGNDIYSLGKNGKIDLIAAAAMDNDKYNVWRDDYYPYIFTKGYNNTSKKIATEDEPGGKYLTSTVPNVNNVKLTADYYENSSIEIESNDMYIAKMEIKTQDSGNGANDAYDDEDGLITAADVLADANLKPENVASVAESTASYPLNYVKSDKEKTETENYLTVTYTDGKSEDVRPNAPLAWTAGNDKNKDNALIRSFSTANYIVQMETQSEALGQKLAGATERLWMRIKVPCASGEITMSGSGEVFNSSYNYYDPNEKCQILEGYKDHVITQEEAGGTITMTMQFSITVGGMQNGERVEPILEAWFDNSSYKGYRTDTNPYDEKIELFANPMTVSAQAAYNLAVDNHKTLRHVGYFDMDNKVEITESQYKEMKARNKDVVYGMVAGYGLSLQLRNQNTDKGLRGIAVPSGDISFNVALRGGLYFNGKRVYYNDTGKEVSINPRLWAYKPNSSETTTGYDTDDNTAGVNMDWGDEDDDDRKSYYDSGIDFNVTDTHSGGTWTVTSSNENSSYTREDGTLVPQSELNFLVHGYTMKPVGKTGKAYQFSCGYLQVIIPLNMEEYDFAQNGDYEGFLQSDMHVVAGDMEMAGLTDAEMHGKDATLEDKINGYFSYTNEEELREYAKNETYYDDNYNNGATVGMNIAKSGDGEVNDLYKTNYWLGSDGSTVLNDQRNPELGTNVTGVGSQLYMTSNLSYSSVTVTPANDQKRFLYDPQVDKQAEYYYLTAYDVLMKFDPDAMRPATYEVDGEEKPIKNFTQDQVATELKGITLLNLSDNGYSEWDTTHRLTKNYNLTVLYAAKADETDIGNENEGKGWTYAGWSKESAALDDSQPRWNHMANTRDDGGTADMDNYGFYTTTRGSGEATKEITGLVYYDTLTALEAEGKTCVAVLYQIRNCCVRNGRSVTLGHMMKVSTDTSKIGRSYAFTTDVRGWTTYRPFFRDKLTNGSDAGWTRFVDDNGNTLTTRSALLYQDLIEGNGQQASAPQDHWLTSKKYGTKQWNLGQVNVQRPGLGNYYQKTQYSNGYEVGGSHSGYTGGNTVLIATQNASVDITTADYSSGNIRQTDYQLDEGQRTVTVQVTPKITMQSNVKKDLEVFDGLTQTDISLDVTLPEDLTLQEGTLTFDYSHSSYNRGDLTWTAQYQYWDENEQKWKNFDFEQNYAQNYEKRTTRLHLTTTITDVQKTLPVLSFKAGIGYPADPSLDIEGSGTDDGSAWYMNLIINAEIHSTYEEEGVNASLGRTDSTEIKVIKNTRTVINKTAATNLVEIGNDLAYDLTYVHQVGATSSLELCDVLPYNSKEFHGAYALKSITVTVQQNADVMAPWDHGNLTVKYADTKSVVRNNDGVVKRAETMTNAAKGTELTTVNSGVTKGANSTTYTLKQMPIHTASGRSDLGSLYLKFNDLPECTVKVHVVLAVAQEQDGTNVLLKDADMQTTQQSGDIYSNSYFVRSGGPDGSTATSPTASIKVRSRSISGLVWMDQNYDGIYTTKLDDTGKQNVGSDKTLAGVIVTLVQKKDHADPADVVYTDAAGNTYCAVTDTLGNAVQPVTTTSDGHYTFENLKQGSYRVLFTDSEKGYTMENGSQPVLPFDKLSVTKREAKGDTSNKTAPQYDTDDSTLLAAVSDEISLGDAVLTGRDDKTNINAGFYYTELRLAKVWQNIPDADKAAKAKVDFTLTAAQNENVLEEAVYTLSNTTVSKPAKTDENAEGLTLFGTFVGDKVKVTDDSTAERTVRWQTEQGLPLQAENANGPITYTLKQDTVRADSDTWIGNVSFVQQQTTEKVSSGAASDNSVIATRFVAVNTARTYEVLIHKLSDVENKELEQAEFTATLQPASPLDKLLGSKVEIKSQQTIQRTEDTEEIRYRLADLTAGTYILAETKAPLGYAKDPVKYKLTITDRDENDKHTLPTLTLEDDKENLLYTAAMTQDEETGDYIVDVKADENRENSTASAVMTEGRCLKTIETAQTEQEQSNLPIRTQISMEITDSYLFSLPFTGGSGMNRSLLQGVAVMVLAAAAFAVTAAVHRKKKNHS